MEQLCSILQPLAQSWSESVALLESAKNTYQSEATDEAWEVFQEALQACEKAQAKYTEQANEKMTYAGKEIKRSHAVILGVFERQVSGIFQGFSVNESGELIRLAGHGDNIRECPSYLPDSVEELDLVNTSVSSLPDVLPASLWYLEMGRTGVSTLPEIWPPNLLALKLANTSVDTFPPNLPHCVRRIELDNTSVTRLPDFLPTSLEQLYLSGTQINDIPKVLPPNLQTMELRRTPFAKRADAQAIVAELEEKYPGLEITI
jgi:hypothetical protein